MEKDDYTIVNLTFGGIVVRRDKAGRDYFAYEVKVESYEEYTVHLRYRSIYKFHNYLQRRYPNKTLPPFPSKTMFLPTLEECQKRKKIFQAYFEQVLLDNDINQDRQFRNLFDKQLHPVAKQIFRLLRVLDVTHTRVLSLSELSEHAFGSVHKLLFLSQVNTQLIEQVTRTHEENFRDVVNSDTSNNDVSANNISSTSNPSEASPLLMNQRLPLTENNDNMSSDSPNSVAPPPHRSPPSPPPTPITTLTIPNNNNNNNNNNNSVPNILPFVELISEENKQTEGQNAENSQIIEKGKESAMISNTVAIRKTLQNTDSEYSTLFQTLECYCLSLKKSFQSIEHFLALWDKNWNKKDTELSAEDRTLFIRNVITFIKEVATAQTQSTQQTAQTIERLVKYFLELAAQIMYHNKIDFNTAMRWLVSDGRAGFTFLKSFAVITVPLILSLAPLASKNKDALLQINDIVILQEKIEEILSKNIVELEQIGALFRLLAQLYQQVSEKLRIVESLWKELSEYIEQWLKDVTEMTNFIEENRTASPLMQDIAIRIDAVKHSYSRLSKHATEYLLELQKLGLLSCQTKDILE